MAHPGHNRQKRRTAKRHARQRKVLRGLKRLQGVTFENKAVRIDPRITVDIMTASAKMGMMALYRHLLGIPATRQRLQAIGLA